MSRHIRKNFEWVSDGVYDHSFYCLRYLIANGHHHMAISKMWLDNGGPEDVAPEMRLPWGSYPDVPPKPSKQ